MPFLIRSLACIIAAGALLAASPAEAQSQKPKPKEPTAAQLEAQRAKFMAWCIKKYGFGRPVQVRYKFGKWYCRYEM